MTIVQHTSNHIHSYASTIAQVTRTTSTITSPYIDLDAYKSAIAGWYQGQLGLMSRLYETMYQSAALYAVIQQRCKGVSSIPISITPSGKSSKHTKLYTMISDNMTTIYPSHIIESMTIDPIMMGLWIYQLSWSLSKEHKLLIPEVSSWTPHHTRIDMASGEYEVYTQTREDGETLIDSDGSGWILCQPWGRTDGYKRGLIAAAADITTRHSYTQRDMQVFCEKNGNPIIIAQIPQEYYESDKESYVQALSNLASASVVPIMTSSSGASMDVSYLQPQGTGWEAMVSNLDRCERELALLVLGQNLSTQVDGGSRAAAEVHDGIRHLYSESDMIRVSSYMQRISDLISIEAYGTKVYAPIVSFARKDPTKMGVDILEAQESTKESQKEV